LRSEIRRYLITVAVVGDEDPDQRADRFPEHRRRDRSVIAGDHAARFELVDTIVDGRRAQPYLARELGIGRTSVVPERAEQDAVDVVHGVSPATRPVRPSIA